MAVYLILNILRIVGLVVSGISVQIRAFRARTDTVPLKRWVQKNLYMVGRPGGDVPLKGDLADTKVVATASCCWALVRGVLVGDARS